MYSHVHRHGAGLRCGSHGTRAACARYRGDCCAVPPIEGTSDLQGMYLHLLRVCAMCTSLHTYIQTQIRTCTHTHTYTEIMNHCVDPMDKHTQTYEQICVFKHVSIFVCSNMWADSCIRGQGPHSQARQGTGGKRMQDDRGKCIASWFCILSSSSYDFMSVWRS